MTSSATPELPEASLRFAQFMPGVETVIRQFPSGTKTAADAAAAIGCPVAAIVKSLVFMVERPDAEMAVVALVPGDLYLDTGKLAAAAGGSHSRRATLEEVKASTGFAAGGTPPFGHASPLQVFADHRMKRHDPVWAAAGTPTTVFPISLSDLERLSSPTWADLAVE